MAGSINTNNFEKPLEPEEWQRYELMFTKAMNEATNRALTPSRVVQGYLEGSGVQVATEMVNMIVAQRAYEMNSKAIQTADDMLSLANQLKR